MALSLNIQIIRGRLKWVEEEKKKRLYKYP